MNPIHILLIEDNEGDIYLIKEALVEGALTYKISVAQDGQKALDFLTNIKEDRDFPDLILLDINLPKVNGLEVLQILKKNALLKKIPVIMLTTSSADKDIITSYENYANCYITKPLVVDDFVEIVDQIKSFWLNLVKLPNKN